MTSEPFSTPKLQDGPVRTYIIVNDSEQSWRSILTALLQRQEPEVSGRADIPEELRRELKKLARGECAERDIQQICEKVAGSLEALRLLAGLLRESEENPSNLKNP
jgi:hypothetical protein